jgi:hypothetical protein
MEGSKRQRMLFDLTLFTTSLMVFDLNPSNEKPAIHDGSAR